MVPLYLVRRDWLEALYSYLDYSSHTPKEMTRCIMRGVTTWLTQQDAPDIHHITYLASESLVAAYQEQTRIGWDQFIRGRISLKWSIMIRHAYQQINHERLHTNNNTQKRRILTPESWAKGLISLNWEFVNLLWEDRINSVKSHEDGNELQPSNYFLLQTATYKLYNHRLRNPSDIAWLVKSHDEISKMSSKQLQLWINNIDLLNKLNDHEYT